MLYKRRNKDKDDIKFLAETVEMRRQWHNITKDLKEKTNQNSIPTEISFLLLVHVVVVVRSCLLLTHIQLLIFCFVRAIGQTTFATVMSVKAAANKLQHHIHLKGTSNEGN